MLFPTSPLEQDGDGWQVARLSSWTKLHLNELASSMASESILLQKGRYLGLDNDIPRRRPPAR